MDSGIKIALITGAITFFGVIVSLIISINTSRLAARKDMVALIQQDNDTLRAENRALKIQADAQEREIDELRGWIEELREQIRALGGVPASPKRKEVKIGKS